MCATCLPAELSREAGRRPWRGLRRRSSAAKRAACRQPARAATAMIPAMVTVDLDLDKVRAIRAKMPIQAHRWRDVVELLLDDNG